MTVEGPAQGSNYASDAQTWALLGPGEQLVGQPAWDATVTGIWLLQGTGRRLDLVHLDGPGLASVRATLPWDGTTGPDRNAIAGVASDGRGLIVRGTAGDLLVDGDSGRWAELPAGARFVGWSRAATTATPEKRPFCAPSENEDLSTTQIAGLGEPFVGGLAGGTGIEPSPRPAADASGLAAAHTSVGGGLRLLLPDGACASFVSAEAVPVDDPGATPVAFDPTSDDARGAGGGARDGRAARGPVDRPAAARDGWRPGAERPRAPLPRRRGGAGPVAVPRSIARGQAGLRRAAHGFASGLGGPHLDGPGRRSRRARRRRLDLQRSCQPAPASRPRRRVRRLHRRRIDPGRGHDRSGSRLPGTAAADRWTRVTCAGLPRDATPVSVDLPDARAARPCSSSSVDRRAPTTSSATRSCSVSRSTSPATRRPPPWSPGSAFARRRMRRRRPASSSRTSCRPARGRWRPASSRPPARCRPSPARWERSTGRGRWPCRPACARPGGPCSRPRPELRRSRRTAAAVQRQPDAVGRMPLSLSDPGDWVISVTLTLPGPDGVDGSATLLWHVRVLERATPAP